MQIKDEGNYTYAFLEKLNVIIVWKDGSQKYLLRVYKSASGSFAISCNCPSGVYRKYCKHESFCVKEFNFNRTVKPRDTFKQFAEEYYEEWYDKNHISHRQEA